MQEIKYVGEQLWIQSTGHFLILSSFFSALFILISSILYFKAHEDQRITWAKWIRGGFYFHSFSLIGIIGLILWMMSDLRYEYHYVWEHVSDDLPMKYILSAFWEGQEGSFLLWMFWNLVLGFFLIRRKDPFVISNLGVLFGVQLLLVSMILGVYVGETRIGSNPFLLLRQTMDIPIFKNADYVSLIKGNGMNPLLQNYWMLIHPPTLFLGFASVVVPVCYGISGLLLGKYEEWLKPALPWSLFSASVLGLGILMGGAWAYEALSFGGYWAWDPVENMSLVPWLVLVGGIHAHLVAQHTRYSIRASFILYGLAFALVIYSTYLTRSGVLGDTSVHAFTGLGLGWQLLFFIAASVFIPMWVYISATPHIPRIKEEEALSSREFWMFIGSLTLLFSAGLISFSTSIPVYNKLLDFIAGLAGTDWSEWHKSAPVDVVAHHNRFQLWIGVLIGFLTGFSIFLRYQGGKLNGLQKSFWKNILLNSLASLALTILTYFLMDQKSIPVLVLAAAGWFSFFGSLGYLLKYGLSNPRSCASIASHSGFGLLILGIIFTGVNKKNLVPERFFQEDFLLNDDPETAGKHFLLIKEQPKLVKNYQVTYLKDTMEARFRHYNILFQEMDTMGNKGESFVVAPQIQYDNKLTKVAASNPSIKRYLHKDVFTLIAQIPAVQMDAEAAQKAEDSLKYEKYLLGIGDTAFGSKQYFILKKFYSGFAPSDFKLEQGDLSFGAEIEVRSLEDTAATLLTPGIIFRGNTLFRFPGESDKKGIRIQINEEIFEAAYPLENDADFKTIVLKEGQSLQINDGRTIELKSFNREPSSTIYEKKEGDIAIAANLILKEGGKEKTVNPIYLIREQTIIPIPDRIAEPFMSFYFTKVNPDNGEMTFRYSENKNLNKIPVEISENAPRTDYLVMEAIVFPGINLVWLGSLLMISGLAAGAYFRKKAGTI